jgi:DNA-binding PadR family transcriptional regulator
MAEKSHVPRSTLYEYLEPLLKEKLIETFFRDRHHSVRGRRYVYYRITEKYEEELRLDLEIVKLKSIIQKLEKEGEIIS